MAELAVGAGVERSQPGRDGELDKSFAAESEGVPGQAERPARLQLAGPDGQRFGDQPGGRSVPLTGDSAHI